MKNTLIALAVLVGPYSSYAAPKASLCSKSAIVTFSTFIDRGNPMLRFNDGTTLRWVLTQGVTQIGLAPAGKASVVDIKGCRFMTNINEEVFLITEITI